MRSRCSAIRPALPAFRRTGWVSACNLAFFIFASSAIACSSTPGGASDAGQGGGEDGQTLITTDAGAGAPSLTELEVVLSDGFASALVPAFSAGVHDYYVRCAAGENAVTVTVKASSGANGTLAIETPATPAGIQKPTGSTAPEQTLGLMLEEGQAIVATATSGHASQDYWVRCLPHDFVQIEWETNASGGTRTPGYYLLGNNWPVANESAAYAMVLDSNGVPVWYYRQAENQTGEGVYDIDTLESGEISFLASPSAVPWAIDQLSPAKTTGIGPAGPELDDHELRLLSNGDYLLFTIPIETGVDLTGLSLVTGQALGTNSNIASCKILEVTTSGSVVWSWDVTDHFDPATDCTYATTGASNWHAPDGGPVYDVFHCNSIDVDPANGNLLVSARNLDSVFYVERSSGAVLWKMGGPSASRDKAAYVPVAPADTFRRQHDARLQPGWSTECGGRGQISMFDDESATSNPARGVVYNVNVGSATGGGSCPPAGGTVAWQYAGSASSQYMGSFRIDEDGSRVIDWGTGGTTALVFTEVDVAGNELLDLAFLPGGSSYRTVKVPLSAFSLSALRSASGQ